MEAPWSAQFLWLHKQIERVEREEVAHARFGTVYVRYGVVPERPVSEKPPAHTYLTHARRLIPRRRSGLSGCAR